MASSGFVRRSSRTVYENRWLRFEAHEIDHPNGVPGEHGVVVVPAAIAVVVLDGSDLLLARQARFAIDRIVLEVVKGGAHSDEPPLIAAQRELREELGLEAERWDALGVAYEIPSIVTGAVSLFLARETRAAAGTPEAVESIEAQRMPFSQALLAAGRGGLDDAITGIALLRARQRLEDEAR